MTINNLTDLESFSSTAELTKQLAALNHFKYSIIGIPSSRIIGVVAIPLASLVDVFTHAGLAAGKAVTGIIISPYNTFAVLLFPKMAAPRDLEFSSALIHLMRVVDSLFAGATLPFICLLNPDRAYQYMNRRLEPQKTNNDDMIIHKEESLKKNTPPPLTIKMPLSIGPPPPPPKGPTPPPPQLPQKKTDPVATKKQINTSTQQLKNATSKTAPTTPVKPQLEAIKAKIEEMRQNKSPQVVTETQSKEAETFNPSELIKKHENILSSTLKGGNPHAVLRLNEELNDIIELLNDFNEEDEALKQDMVMDLDAKFSGLNFPQRVAYFTNFLEKLDKGKKTLKETTTPCSDKQQSKRAPPSLPPRSKK